MVTSALLCLDELESELLSYSSSMTLSVMIESRTSLICADYLSDAFLCSVALVSDVG